MGQSISNHLMRAKEQGHQEDAIEQLRVIHEMLVAKCDAQANGGILCSGHLVSKENGFARHLEWL